MGESILQAASSEDWAKKRKVLAVAFYKEKMIKMVDIVKQCMADSNLRWRKLYVEQKKPMDLIDEISKTLIKILLMCSFGEDISETEIDYYMNGRKTRQTVAFVLREVFHKCIDRLTSAQIVFFPSTAHWYVTPWDRENRANIYRLRELLFTLVQKRREEMKNGTYIDKGDLLAILLQDKLF